MGYNVPPPPIPPKGRYVPKIKQKRGDMITDLKVTIDGREVDLEDAFPVFEELFEDVEDVFAEMESVFSHADTDITKKLNILKMKIAAKHPDKYTFMPAHVQEKMRFQDELRDFEVEGARRHQAIRRNTFIAMTVFSILVVIGFVFAIVLGVDHANKTKETKPTIEQTTNASGSSSL